MRHFFASARRRRLILNLVGVTLIAVLLTMQVFNAAPPIATTVTATDQPAH
jgi:hypothetical protein